MSNICIFTNTLMNGGAEKQAMLLAKALKGEYNVWLVVYYGDLVDQKYRSFINDNKIRTIYLRGNHLFRFVKLIRFLKKESIQVIFSYLLTTNFIGGIAGKLLGINYTYGGIRSSQLSKKKIPFQRFLQNHVNYRTIYNNYKGFEEFPAIGFNKEKAVIIPNCFEIENELIIRENNKPVKILSVGRFHEAKGYFTAIDSVVKLRGHSDYFEYTIIGYGSLEAQIRDYIEKQNASAYIKVIINPADINSYYRISDIYLQTSIFEGLSNTVMEAMSYALPIVTTNVGDNNRLVIDNLNGYLVEARNVIQISNALNELLESYDRRIQFGTSAYNLLKENYSLDIFKKNYTKVIDQSVI
jgi:glycosyltransferase involved in cell wall biosynthesis